MCEYDNFFFFQAEDGIRDVAVTGVQTCALPIYFSGGPRRGFTFGLPAHRSFGQKKYGAVRKEKKEGPYILGLKTPRLYGHPVNDWASNPWEPAVTLPCRSAPATPSRARQQVAFPARTSPERKIVS